jgi:hypothetical protein
MFHRYMYPMVSAVPVARPDERPSRDPGEQQETVKERSQRDLVVSSLLRLPQTSRVT